MKPANILLQISSQFSSNILFIVAAFGILGNLVAFVVFASFTQAKKSSANFLIQTLCVIDLGYMVTLLIGKFNESDAYQISVYYGHIGPLLAYCSKQFFAVMSTWMMVLISADRLIHIALPLWVIRFGKMRMCMIISVSVISSISLILTASLSLYRWKTYPSPMTSGPVQYQQQR